MDSAIVDLSKESQANLCEAFLSAHCMDPANAAFCGNSCISSSCPEAAVAGSIDSQCEVNSGGDDITVGLVERCGGGDDASCRAGGGCMIDALETFCGI